MPFYQPPKNQRSKKRSITTPLPSQPLTLSVTKLSDDGRGIAKYEGKTIFVSGALPGETVRAQLTRVKPRFSEAKVTQLMTISDDRVEPRCLLTHRCGGCSVQHLTLEQQVVFKQDIVLSQLKRWSAIEPVEVLPPITSHGFAYRQRVRLAVDYSKAKELFFGFRESGSHRLVSINECAVLSERLSTLLPMIKQWLGQIPNQIVSHIELIDSATGPSIVVRHTRQLARAARQQLGDLLMPCGVFNVWFQGEKEGGLATMEEQVVDPRLMYRLDDFSLSMHFHPQDFIQANHAVNQHMVRQAVELLAPQADEHIVDLFCGIGNFSLALAKYAKQVVGIEGVAPMVQRAADNASTNGLDNTHFAVNDLANATGLFKPIFDIGTKVESVLLDPPRSGAKVVCEHIGLLAPQRIVYVSCDSATFARDAQVLVANGYKLSKLGILDMFPHTSHVEVMSLFETV